jgi:serine/threonine protein phosphatase PrpC/CRP-like cAMP-binding protein
MPETPSLQFWPLTDVGRIRDHNEDAFLVDEKMNLFVVADGMGGHAAGEVASNVAVHALRNTLKQEQDLLDNFEKGVANAAGRLDVLRLLEQGVLRACTAVYEEAQKDPGKRGMGTTLVALLVVGSRGFIAHVGDSRIYMVRNQSVHQLTKDHSLINELLARGRIKPDQIDKLQFKNAMTRAVGVYESVEVDTLDFDVLAGDRFLLCSDGLCNYTEDADIGRVFTENPDEQAARKFVDFANRAGGEDNITAVVVKVPDLAAGLDRLAEEVNLKLETLHAMPLFRYLTYQELVRVMNLADVRSYGRSEPVVREGEDGEEMFIVLRGNARVHTGDALIVNLGPGQHFGEMSLIDRSPRSASVTSEDESTMMVIARKDFFDIVRKDHDVAVKLLWSFLGVLSERLRRTSRDLSDARESLSLMDATEEILTDDDIQAEEILTATNLDVREIRAEAEGGDEEILTDDDIEEL